MIYELLCAFCNRQIKEDRIAAGRLFSIGVRSGGKTPSGSPKFQVQEFGGEKVWAECFEPEGLARHEQGLQPLRNDDW